MLHYLEPPSNRAEQSEWHRTFLLRWHPVETSIRRRSVSSYVPRASTSELVSNRLISFHRTRWWWLVRRRRGDPTTIVWTSTRKIKIILERTERFRKVRRRFIIAHSWPGTRSCWFKSSSRIGIDQAYWIRTPKVWKGGTRWWFALLWKLRISRWRKSFFVTTVFWNHWLRLSNTY
jgi:hypothetical protein